jgi:hypothetical protein
MNTLRAWLWLVVPVLLVAFSPPAGAQGIASSFEQLQLLVREGDTVTVRDSSGIQTTGRIQTLSSSVLTLVTSGTGREFRETNVTSIRQRGGDSLLNGMMWGSLVGIASMGGVLVAACGGGCDSNDTPYLVGYTVLGGTVGLGVGAGVDAMISGLQTIYQRPERATTLLMAPILFNGRRGVAFSLRY